MRVRVLASFALLSVVLAAGAAGAHAQVVRATPAAPSTGWIGVSISVVTTSESGHLRTTAVITGVSEGSPAAEAGVAAGDVLVSINGESATRAADRLRLRAGDRVRLEVLRDGGARSYALTATPRRVVTVPAPASVYGDSTVDVLFRAMDSLRVRLVRARPGGVWVEPIAGTAPLPDDPAPEVRAPFEFFVFGGERQDSLRHAMLELNRAMQVTHARHAELDRLVRTRAANDRLREDLGAVRRVMEAQTRQASDLRRAMSEAARAEAAERIWVGGDAVVPGARPPARPDTTTWVFRPLTPYLLGQNRAAGAEVVELNPALATYFRVERGVLVVDVPRGTPAEDAGLRPGDVITGVGTREVRTVDDLRSALARSRLPITIALVRQGRAREATLRQ